MNVLGRTPLQIDSLLRQIRMKRGWSQTEIDRKASLRQETVLLIATRNPATKLKTIVAEFDTLLADSENMRRRVLQKGTACNLK